MKINGVRVKGRKFAYDGCHKIYVIEDIEDEKMAEDGYKIYPIKDLEEAYRRSCDLRFIYNWKLTKTYVAQFEEATFEK